MSANGLLQIALYLGVLLALAKPLGWYMAQVYEGKLPTFVRWMAPVENLFYRLCGVDSKQEMRWTRYASAMLWFALLSVLAVYAMQRLQGLLSKQPDATLAELGARMDRPFRTSTMDLWLRKLGWRYKKNSVRRRTKPAGRGRKKSKMA